jgi:hypothetical protein
MGPVSGLVGIDIDDQAGIDLLADICNGIPDTFNFSTPGGSHRRRLFFRHPDQPIATKSLRVNGIEVLRIQGKGAQTVMPPTIHPCGVAYGLEWEDRPLAPFPPALLDFLTQEPVKDESPPKGLAAIVAGGASPIVRARAYLAKCDPCVSGHGGSAQSLKIACKLIHGVKRNGIGSPGMQTSRADRMCKGSCWIIGEPLQCPPFRLRTRRPMRKPSGC